MRTSIEEVKEILMDVYDPEMGMDIINLGLVYHIDVTDEKVFVDFTLTSIFCPLEEEIKYWIVTLVSKRTGLECVANVVWDPPWSEDKMSEEARILIGF